MQITIVVAYIVSLLVQVAYPLGVLLYFHKKTRTPWILYVYGALVFAVFQMFTWLPLSAFADVAWSHKLTTAGGQFVWLVATALLTAVFEEGGRWFGYARLFPQAGLRLTWRNGAAFGLGHNALETMWLIAGLTFIGLVAYLLSAPLRGALAGGGLPAGMSPSDPLVALASTTVTWSEPLVVALERVLALPHQVAWALLVMESLVSRQKRWFAFALLYHTSVAIIVPGLATLAGFAVAEGVNVVLASVSIWIIVRLRDLAVARDGV